ncbi:MAG TPA: hypothetical protein VLJ17_07480 [Xanthobacteraceae bacterium]|nr:hypothetical protein [Xanthobacteraceae bacterium]
MRECLSLEIPLIEPEWYLVRYEVEHADEVASGNEKGTRRSLEWSAIIGTTLLGLIL